MIGTTVAYDEVGMKRLNKHLAEIEREESKLAIKLPDRETLSAFVSQFSLESSSHRFSLQKVAARFATSLLADPSHTQNATDRHNPQRESDYEVRYSFCYRAELQPQSKCFNANKTKQVNVSGQSTNNSHFRLRGSGERSKTSERIAN